MPRRILALIFFAAVCARTSAHPEDILVDPSACRKATQAEIDEVNRGNAKKDAFLEACAKVTNASPWCLQLIRPNPDSFSVFECTYGKGQVHQLINPDESTWPNAFEAVRIVDELYAENVHACVIYNWWRPEPYNRNVGGAPGRHPFGTAVDVRFCSRAAMEQGFVELCRMRRQGRVRAVGYYGTTALHFGIGDRVGNTWGKSCPR